MRHLTLVVAVVGVGLTACRSDSPVQPKQPQGLQALVFDGAHSDGNKDFFFLPPLVANPVGTPNYDAGRFNPRLAPTVEVCKLAANPLLVPNTDCAAAPIFGPARMTLDASNEQYQLSWDTQASLLDATAFYRISVRGAARGTVLGFLDVDPVLGGMKNVKTGDVFQFQDGRTLPIKVRIELGAFGSSNSSDQAEQVVPAVLPPTGLDVTTNTGFAGAHFSNGWLPDGFDQVVVIIERISPNCLNTPLEQLEGCYRFRTDPDLHGLGPDGTDLTFAIPVVAGVCFQYPGDIGHGNEHPFELMRSEEVLVENELRVTPAVPLLDEQAAPFLRCDGFGATPPSIGAAFRAGRLGDVAKASLFAVTHAIGRVIEPKALHAVDFGAGGSTNEFSRFGYARPAAMAVTAGDGASAPAGSTIDAAVTVQNDHHGVLTGVVGQSVTFTVTGGGGTVSTPSCSEGGACSANTNSSGVAGVTWRLGPGLNTIQVTTNYVSNSPQTITATGTSGNLTISSFTRSFANPTVADDIVFTAQVTNAGTDPVGASSMTLRVGGETFPPAFPVPALDPGQSFVVNRTVNLDVAQGYIAEAKADVNNAVPETNESDNSLQQNFVVTALQTSILDATGDALIDGRVPTAPDLVSANATVNRGNLTLQLRFAPGTFDPNATMATVVLDIDQNNTTGFSGVDGAHNDAGLIGHEYLIEAGSQSIGSTPTLATFNPATGGFSSQKAGTLTFVTDGVDVVMPLSALGGDRGELNFKVLAQTQITFPPDGTAYTGIVDYLTDVGLFPGSLVSHPVVIGLAPRSERAQSGGMQN
jgi:CARDB protein